MLDQKFARHGRYLTSAESLWFGDVIELLKNNRKEIGQKKRIKTRLLGQLTLMVGALVNPEVRLIYPFLNKAISLKMDPKLVTALEQ